MKKLSFKKLAVTTITVFALTQLSAQTEHYINIYGNNPPPEVDLNNPNWWRVQAAPCIPAAAPWVIGGNNMSPYAPITEAGTCNDYPFILKANNFSSVFITQGGNIGINQAAPSAAFEVRHPISLQQSSFKIFGDLDGNLESSTRINLNFASGKDFNINEGFVSTAPVSRFSLLPGGNAGFGASSATCKLTVDATTQSNTTGMSVIVNSSTTDAFDIWNSGTNQAEFRIKPNGYVYSREINVQLSAFPDYVFSKSYKLQSLESLESYIKVNKHLPNVPSAAEVEKNGANLGELAKIQMEKIEELTLYVIQLKKELDELKKANKN